MWLTKAVNTVTPPPPKHQLCAANTAVSETKQERDRLWLNCMRSVCIYTHAKIITFLHSVHWKLSFRLSLYESVLFLQQKSFLCASACVHLQYLCLSILPSITSSLVSQGSWVLHVISPWEDQTGTSPFLWVCVRRVPDTDIQSSCRVLALTCEKQEHLWSRLSSACGPSRAGKLPLE